VCISVGPHDPWIILWIMVKLKRLGGTQIPHDIGEELRWHPWLLVLFFGVLYESYIHAWNMAQG